MPTKVLKPAQRKAAEEELKGLERAIAAPSVPGFPDDKTGIITQARKTKEMLASGAPAPTTPERRDALLKESKTLEGEIKNGMPTRMHMERGTHGVVEQNRLWGINNTHKVSRWKDIWRELEPDNLDPDLSNIERIRPLGREGEAVPRKMYSGVDVVDGEIVHEGIPDAEKIEARTATVTHSDDSGVDVTSFDVDLNKPGTMGTVAEWVGEPEVEAKPEPVPASCDVCGKNFPTGARGVRLHKLRAKSCKDG